MGKYKITAGQNIYDIAMHLYGEHRRYCGFTDKQSGTLFG